MGKEIYLSSVMELLPGHIYWKDINGVLLGCNREQASFLGLSSAKDIVGLTDYDITTKDKADAIWAMDEEVMRTGISKTSEEIFVQKDGSEVVFLSKKEPLKNKKGKIIGILGISVDITERKLAEEELRIAKERAELASEIKSQFIQNMEHDLRTPAAGVAGMLNILIEQGDMNPELKETMQKLAKASQRLLDFLNDIIAFDKYSSGQLPILSQRFDLHDLVHSVIDMQTPAVESKNIDLMLDVAKDVPINIISDKHRIFRIMLNLVGNAVKFTKEGYVKVSIGIAKQIDPKHCLLKIVVTDTGIGISEDKIHRIYERFERCIPANRGTYPGAGLGLSITKQFVDELEGEIEVASREGEGTTFTCVIPCAIPLTDITNYSHIFKDQISQEVEVASNKKVEETHEKIVTAKPVVPVTNKKLRVLLVEDDEMAQLSARSILEKDMRTDFTLAKTGNEALKQFSKNEYDIVFMDLGLPDIIGTDVAQEMRRTNKVIPIIALTAHDKEEMRIICRAVGMNDYMVKPLSKAKAQIVFERWVSHGKSKIAMLNEDVEIDSNKVLDLDMCAKIINSKDAAKQMWQIFAGYLPKYLQEMQQYFAKQDVRGLHNLSHKLKGASLYAGAPKLMNVSTKLSDATIKKTVKLADIENLYNDVCAVITETLQALQDLGY